MTAATARAYPNIALVKYWGKRDEQLMLPAAGSLSMTLDAYPTTTEVALADAATDVFTLNGETITAATDSALRVQHFLDLVRERAGSASRAIVTSTNEAPTAAGLASSASGFAALACAAAQAYGLDFDTAELSRLARRGSGSASRSVISRFAIWHAGDDDASSFAEEITAPDMRMIVCKIDGAKKKVSSRAGMQLTAQTSPFYSDWVSSTEDILVRAQQACAADDFTTLGELTELHAYRMHAVIQSSEPPVRYLAPASYAAFDRVAQLREDGVETYATADAGPNVVAIARPNDAGSVAEGLREFGDVQVVAPGPGAQLLPGKVVS